MSQEYSYYNKEYIQPGWSGNGYQTRSFQPAEQGYQGDFLHQRHKSDYCSGSWYGRCDRCKLPHFKALAKNGISVFLVSQASSENSTSIGVRNADADLACEVLNEEFAKEIEMGEISPILAERNLATVAIVGENMKHTPGIAGKLFGTLGRNGINVIACAQGASETNISFVVDSKSLRKSLNVIHDSFFLSEYQVLNLFICGVGTVGGSLVEQIRCQQQKLMMENGLKLHVVGIIDAAKAMFSREGFDLANFREELLEKGRTAACKPSATRLSE